MTVGVVATYSGNRQENRCQKLGQFLSFKILHTYQQSSRIAQ
jgi:hypothetical protein